MFITLAKATQKETVTRLLTRNGIAGDLQLKFCTRGSRPSHHAGSLESPKKGGTLPPTLGEPAARGRL